MKRCLRIWRELEIDRMSQIYAWNEGSIWRWNEPLSSSQTRKISHVLHVTDFRFLERENTQKGIIGDTKMRSVF